MHNLEDQSRRHAWCWGINLVAALFLLQTSFPVLHRATTIMPELMRPTDVLLEEAVPHRFRYVNEVLPEEAKLLFVNTNRGFFCHRPYLADSFFEASQVAWLMAPAQNQEELASILEDRGITHLLIATDDWNISYPMAFYGLLTDPRLIRPLYLSPDGRYQIVELNPGEQP